MFRTRVRRSINWGAATLCIGALAAVLTGRTPAATSTSDNCVGDCGGDAQVTVDELLALVNIALGNADVSTCMPGDANSDDQITIDEILAAINNALAKA